MLLDTQVRGRTGSPRVTGSTRRLRAGTSPGSLAVTRLRPPPLRRTLPSGSGSPSKSSSPRLIVERGEPGDPCHHLQAAPACGPHFGGCKHALSSLVEFAADCLPSSPNAILVDHAAEVRLFAPIRNPRAMSHTVARPRSLDSIIVRSLLNRPRLTKAGSVRAPKACAEWGEWLPERAVNGAVCFLANPLALCQGERGLFTASRTRATCNNQRHTLDSPRASHMTPSARDRSCRALESCN
jgi:hypothetical protein